MLKPIETCYKGYRFRSRLEARWAVFFDALNLQWEYEKEGYDLGEVGWYLPDFWLPEWEHWIEVKPRIPTEDEMNKAKALVAQGGFPLIFLHNPEPVVFTFQRKLSDDKTLTARVSGLYRYITPDSNSIDSMWFDICPYCGKAVYGRFKSLCPLGISRTSFTYVAHPKCKKTANGKIYPRTKISEAITTACSARFEHGETPKWATP